MGSVNRTAVMSRVYQLRLVNLPAPYKVQTAHATATFLTLDGTVPVHDLNALVNAL